MWAKVWDLLEYEDWREISEKLFKVCAYVWFFGSNIQKGNACQMLPL